MTTTEHLQKIRARCVELLEIASKRTPGKWSNPKGPGSVYNDAEQQLTYTGEYEAGDAVFIASCAGPAEAGWRATIAAIDFISASSRYAQGGAKIDQPFADKLNYTVKQLIAAWPEETL
jgi:hypothetical protein